MKGGGGRPHEGPPLPGAAEASLCQHQLNPAEQAPARYVPADAARTTLMPMSGLDIAVV